MLRNTLHGRINLKNMGGGWLERFVDLFIGNPNSLLSFYRNMHLQKWNQI